MAAVIFGAVHLLAWNSVFPSYAEKILWRVSSFVTMFGPLAALGAGSTLAKFHKGNTALISILGLLSLIFCLCWAFVIVEALRSLYYLPPAVFVATWTANVPHLG
jgi:hypothetical protein